ncbi:pinin-like [Pecten maximus]|uniref:pinin-like n=1 Tax=Pecten maximus TaxID=6579 RepID=UPI0014584B37|nr:pinin-like [Pecten maximus]
MADVRGVSALQDELEKAKESLKDVDDNIKKLTGRDPTEPRPSTRRVTAVPDGRGRERLLLQARWGPDEDVQAKRRVIGGAFSRLAPMHRMGRGRPPRGRDSGDEDDLPNKPTIQSSVIATPKESRTRQSSIEEQNSDRKGTARNRRMFGLLLGTLRKFKDEAKETEDKEVQRKQIEQKLEEKAISEKEDLLRERHQLFLERKQQQAKIRRLEYKMELIEIHDAWEKETRKLENFIHTKAKPHIFYLPKSMDAVLEGKRKETVKYVEDMIDERRRKLQIEIEDLMAKNQQSGKADMEGDEEEEGAMEGNRNTDKENRRRKSSGERVDLHRQLEQRGSHRGGRDGEIPRKRRKSDSVAEDDRHSRAGKHRRRSREEGDRSGGRRDSHKVGASRRDDKARDRTEPRVEINYNDEEDEEEEEEGELRTESTNSNSNNNEENKDKRTVEQSDTSGKLDKMDTGDTQAEISKSAKQTQAMMAEDEEEGEEGEVHDAVDE